MRNYNLVDVVQHIEETAKSSIGGEVVVFDQRGVCLDWITSVDLDGVTRLKPSAEKLHHYNLNDSARFPYLYRSGRLFSAAGVRNVAYFQNGSIGRVLFLEEFNGKVALCTDQDYIRPDTNLDIEYTGDATVVVNGNRYYVDPSIARRVTHVQNQ